MALYKDLTTLNNEIYDRESIKNAIKNILLTKKELFQVNQHLVVIWISSFLII